MVKSMTGSKPYHGRRLAHAKVVGIDMDRGRRHRRSRGLAAFEHLEHLRIRCRMNETHTYVRLDATALLFRITYTGKSWNSVSFFENIEIERISTMHI